MLTELTCLQLVNFRVPSVNISARYPALPDHDSMDNPSGFYSFFKKGNHYNLGFKQLEVPAWYLEQKNWLNHFNGLWKDLCESMISTGNIVINSTHMKTITYKITDISITIHFIFVVTINEIVATSSTLVFVVWVGTIKFMPSLSASLVLNCVWKKRPK